ncbi:MAG: ISNCY family transposase, partial [Planctomycetes bacterium]|nr:ISNCY family transposase [Planctomycetota bacterium]
VRFLGQVRRRIIEDETIPHEEKVFSIFKPYTQWINKGKAGVPVELGLNVCVLEDQHQFILYHQVMEQETDDKMAVIMVDETQSRFPMLNQCSFDLGFHSPANQKALAERLDYVVLPRKGKLSEVQLEHQRSPTFRAARGQHAAVESCINALEVHGLDCCRDYGGIPG